MFLSNYGTITWHSTYCGNHSYTYNTNANPACCSYVLSHVFLIFNWKQINFVFVYWFSLKAWRGCFINPDTQAVTVITHWIWPSRFIEVLVPFFTEMASKLSKMLREMRLYSLNMANRSFANTRMSLRRVNDLKTTFRLI